MKRPGEQRGGPNQLEAPESQGREERKPGTRRRGIQGNRRLSVRFARRRSRRGRFRPSPRARRTSLSTAPRVRRSFSRTARKPSSNSSMRTDNPSRSKSSSLSPADDTISTSPSAIRRNGQTVDARVLWGPGIGNPSDIELKQRFGSGGGATSWHQATLHRVEGIPARTNPRKARSISSTWAAYDDNYFAALFLPGGPSGGTAAFLMRPTETGPDLFLPGGDEPAESLCRAEGIRYAGRVRLRRQEDRPVRLLRLLRRDPLRTPSSSSTSSSPTGDLRSSS